MPTNCWLPRKWGIGWLFDWKSNYVSGHKYRKKARVDTFRINHSAAASAAASAAKAESGFGRESREPMMIGLLIVIESEIVIVCWRW